MTNWDPAQYLRYQDHRTRPAIDLLGRIDADPKSIWDLGCGPGAITAMLRDRWSGASVTGLDSSSEMLAEAAAIAGIDWVRGDIAGRNHAVPVSAAVHRGTTMTCKPHRSP